MKQKIKIITICLLSTWITVSSQTIYKKPLLGKQYAESELKFALSNKTQHNVIGLKTIIIKDSLTATSVAEPILFEIYGKSNITKQRPYEIYHIKNYWIMTGTLRKDCTGGTFQIIIDDRNSQIIKITHGK